jgi:hypothetical protein
MALAVMCLAGFAAQPIDRSAPPAATDGAAGFTIQRLPARVGIDGRAWMFADVHTGEPPLLKPSGADYELMFSEPDNSGDFERWTVTLQRSGVPPVSLTGERKTAFAYVTPDARYIFLEPLAVIDVKTWRRYELGGALGIAPYASIVAVSRDGRLFIERSSCSMDCSRRTDEEYFELTLPPSN